MKPSTKNFGIKPSIQDFFWEAINSGYLSSGIEKESINIEFWEIFTLGMDWLAGLNMAADESTSVADWLAAISAYRKKMLTVKIFNKTK